MVERITAWWRGLARPERSAFAALAAIAAGMLMLVLGIQLGQALGLLAGLVA